MTPNLPKIVVICGPTGVGKTGFAIASAQRFKSEIVGADSMQIYRHMNIGTAKPTLEEQAAVRHHMVDIVDPDQAFDAAAYVRRADKVIQELIGRSVLPLVVGGTGLYIKALLYGLFESREPDLELRTELQTQAEQLGSQKMHARLAARDPDAAARIHPNDTYRIVRALEIIALNGQPASEQHEQHGFAEPRYRALQIGLTLPRAALNQRIDQRVDMMLAAGLEKEVRRLLEAGRRPETKAMQSLGYRHMVDFIQGRLTWEEAVQTLKRDHRRYAKRQMTWFRADPDIHWLAPDDRDAACALIAAHQTR